MSNSDYPADNLRAFCEALEDSDLEAMRRYATKEPDLFRKLREQKPFPNWVVCDAGKYSSPEAIRLLIELGADINEQDSNRTTGLEWAVIRGRYEAAKTFLEFGADPNLEPPTLDEALVARLANINDEETSVPLLVLSEGRGFGMPVWQLARSRGERIALYGPRSLGEAIPEEERADDDYYPDDARGVCREGPMALGESRLLGAEATRPVCTRFSRALLVSLPIR